MQKRSTTARINSLEITFIEINQTFGVKWRGLNQNKQTYAPKIKILGPFQVGIAKGIEGVVISGPGIK